MAIVVAVSRKKSSRGKFVNKNKIDGARSTEYREPARSLGTRLFSFAANDPPTK